jgi:hypothetical protein
MLKDTLYNRLAWEVTQCDFWDGLATLVLRRPLFTGVEKIDVAVKVVYASGRVKNPSSSDPSPGAWVWANNVLVPLTPKEEAKLKDTLVKFRCWAVKMRRAFQNREAKRIETEAAQKLAAALLASTSGISEVKEATNNLAKTVLCTVQERTWVTFQGDCANCKTHIPGAEGLALSGERCPNCGWEFDQQITVKDEQKRSSNKV